MTYISEVISDSDWESIIKKSEYNPDLIKIFNIGFNFRKEQRFTWTIDRKKGYFLVTEPIITRPDTHLITRYFYFRERFYKVLDTYISIELRLIDIPEMSLISEFASELELIYSTYQLIASPSIIIDSTGERL